VAVHGGSFVLSSLMCVEWEVALHAVLALWTLGNPSH
jgi:hypothetical protein